MDLQLGVTFALLLVSILIITDIVGKRFNLHKDMTRKVVHVGTGLLIAATPFVFDSSLPVIIITAVFIPVIFFAIRKDRLRAIHSTSKRSYGTVYYPLAFLILTLLLWENHKAILVITMLILSFADAFAAIIGERVKNPVIYKFGEEPKSLQGSAVMFIVSAVIVYCGLNLLGPLDGIQFPQMYNIWIAVATAIIATVCESVSYKGSDNLTIPLGAAFTMHFLVSGYPDYMTFMIGFILALLIAIASYRVRFLDGGGSVATFLLGVVVFGIGGWKFSLPILTFFILSSLLSKTGKTRKRTLSGTFQKSSQRDHWQVLANGGIAGVLVLIWYYWPYEILYPMFAGAVAAASADTWGTEIGVLSGKKPRSILNFKPVPIGSSGGVSLLGSLGAFAGSVLIALIAGYYSSDSRVIAVIAVSGFLGGIVDSVLGATVQAQYRCPSCGKVTEKKIHCGDVTTELLSGFEWVDNDIVNAVCTLFGALFVFFGIKTLI